MPLGRPKCRSWGQTKSRGALWGTWRADAEEALEFVAAVLTERNLGAFQAPPGVGVRVPEVVKPGEPFVVSVLDGQPGLTCVMYDAEENRLITMARRRDDAVVASMTVPKPGLYRLEVSGGGYSPVEQLVSAMIV